MTPAIELPQRYCVLFHNAVALLHAMGRWRGAASDAIDSGRRFRMSREDRKAFLFSIDFTTDAFLIVRHEAVSPWLHTARLLSEARQTEIAISAVLRNKGFLPINAPRRDLDSFRAGLVPFKDVDQAVWLESIRAEIRAAASGTTPNEPNPQPAPPATIISPEFKELARLVSEKMKGIQLKVVELVIANGGKKAIPDLAVHGSIGWCGDGLEDNWDGKWESARNAINNKLKKTGWRLIRSDNCAVLIPVVNDKKATKM
jgi:hypothetical protein